MKKHNRCPECSLNLKFGAHTLDYFKSTFGDEAKKHLVMFSFCPTCGNDVGSSDVGSTNNDVVYTTTAQ